MLTFADAAARRGGMTSGRYGTKSGPRHLLSFSRGKGRGRGRVSEKAKKKGGTMTNKVSKTELQVITRKNKTSTDGDWKINQETRTNFPAKSSCTDQNTSPKT